MSRPDLRGQDGAVTILTALLLVALLAASAVAVDLGRLAAVSRDQQGVTDRAALDALHALDADVLAAVEASLERNATGMSADRTVVEVEPVDCEHGLAAPPWTHASGVRVVTSLEVASSFLPATDAATVRREATACLRPAAALRLGSATGALDDGVLNVLLGALLGSEAPLELELVGYRGVADARVDLTLLALESGVGTVDDLLAADLGVLGLLDATVGALAAEGGAVGAALAAELGRLRAPLLDLGVALPPIRLGDLLSLETGDAAGAALAVDAIDLIVAALQLAHAELRVADATHAVALDLAALPGLGGLAPLRLAIVEPPQLAVGRPGQRPDGTWRTEARTAQITLEVELPVGQVVGALDAAHDDEAAARADAFRDRIDALPRTYAGCFGLQPITYDLHAEVAELRFAATQLGLDAVAATLLTGIGDVLGSALSPILCAIPGPHFETIHGRVDEYESLLRAMLAAADGAATTAHPVLRISVGEATARLASATCAPPQRVEVQAASATARVQLPETRLIDLGSLGQVVVALDVPVAGTGDRSLDFVGAAAAPHWPSPVQRVATTDLGLRHVLDGVDASGSSLLLLPIGDVVELVTGSLAPVLGALDGALAPLLGALGLELGVADVQVVDATCAGRRLAD